MTQVVIYGKTNCPWCVKAKELAERYQLNPDYRNIELKKYYDEMKERLPEAKTVPQIFWDGKYLGGYNELSREIENTIGGYGEQLF